MKNTRYIIYVSALVAVLFMSSCVSKKKTETLSLKQMPDSYWNKTDTLNSADVSWRSFFGDSNLIRLIDEALINNPDQLSALQKVEMAKSTIQFSKKALLPSVNANVSAAQRRYGLYTMDGAGNISTDITPGQRVPIHLPDYYVGLQTAWEVDVWGKLRHKKKAALARYLSTTEGKNLVSTNLISQIALHFYTLLALDDQLKIVIETIKLQEEALLIMQIQKEAAVANELAVKQFEAQLLNSKGLELQVIQDIVETESRINFLVGRFPQPVVRTRSEFTGNLPYHVNAGLPSELLQKRPDIRQAELDLIASKADVKSARAAFYPSFTITGGIGYQAFRTAFLFTTPQSMAYALVGGLTAPLINRNAIQREFKQATAAQHQAMYAYQKTILQAFMEVHNEMARIENLGQILEFKSQEAQVLNTAIETSSVLFRTGRANYMEVLMAQRNALKSKLELVDTKKQQYEAVINIYKALGGGWK